MKNTMLLLTGLLLAGTAVPADTAEPSRFQLAAAGGVNLGSSSEAIHLAVAPSFSLNKHFRLGADLAYSYLPLATHARGGGNRAYWGLATLTATPLPSSRVSPYLTLGYGIGRYSPSWTNAGFGKAAALGAGLQLRLSPRASMFVESRFAMVGAEAADGLHMELPVRVGVRFSP